MCDRTSTGTIKIGTQQHPPVDSKSCFAFCLQVASNDFYGSSGALFRFIRPFLPTDSLDLPFRSFFTFGGSVIKQSPVDRKMIDLAHLTVSTVIFCCNPTQFLMSLFQFLVSF